MNLWTRLFGRRGTPAPAAPPRGGATPEAVMQRYFAGIAAHDLEEILATLTPQRARLYSAPGTVDRRRLTVNSAKLLAMAAVDDPVPLPTAAAQYAETTVLKVEYDLNLVEPEQRRDPTLREGRQWSYFIVVCAGPGQPWLIADWGV